MEHLTKSARRALDILAAGGEVPMTLQSVIDFGDLARLNLIEPTSDRTRWVPTTEGASVLQAERVRLGRHF